jgi:hypothetical protein
MKLIHSGKVLKDEDSIESCNIKPNDFLVVMITKVSVREKRAGKVFLLLFHISGQMNYCRQ